MGSDNLIQGDDYTSMVRGPLADYFRDEEHADLMALEVLRVIHRPFSTVRLLEATVSGVARGLVMKTTEHHPVNEVMIGNENQAVLEYSVLRQLYPQFLAVDKCSVPRPLVVIPEAETYVMSFVDGEVLMDKHKAVRYCAKRTQLQVLADWYFLVGRWLKHFQVFTGVRTVDRGAVRSVIERSEHRLRLIEEARDPRIPLDFMARVMRFLEEEFTGLGNHPVEISGRHGDFGPWNIIASTEGITVIDFLGYRLEPLPVDILKMLIFFEHERRSITASRRRVDTLVGSYVRGYGEFPRSPQPLVMICEAMQRIVNLWGAIATPRDQRSLRLQANRDVRAERSWLLAKKKSSLWPCTAID